MKAVTTILAMSVVLGGGMLAQRGLGADVLPRATLADEQSNPDQVPPTAESPSKKLSESKGVIQPPPTGDHSVVTPPPTESTNKAVIAPPGTPGGDQSVQPK